MAEAVAQCLHMLAAAPSTQGRPDTYRCAYSKWACAVCFPRRASKRPFTHTFTSGGAPQCVSIGGPVKRRGRAKRSRCAGGGELQEQGNPHFVYLFPRYATHAVFSLTSSATWHALPRTLSAWLHEAMQPMPSPLKSRVCSVSVT
jgi:hypothetical protein